MSDLSTDHAVLKFTTDAAFKFDEVNEVLERLEARCSVFLAAQAEGAIDHRIEFSVEARYPNQIWEIDVPLSTTRIASEADLSRLSAAFHDAHKRIFEIEDPDSSVEFVTWRAKVSCRLKENPESRLASLAQTHDQGVARQAYFTSAGWTDTPVYRLETLPSGQPVSGPAMIESSYTTVVVDAGTVARRTEAGAICVEILKDASL